MEQETNGNNIVLKFRSTKKRWSRLLDTVQQKKHVLFIFTTNKDKAFFDEVDTALLREYRVSMNLHYKKKGVETIPFETIKKKKR
jgi:putative NADPH-quinone reductase